MLPFLYRTLFRGFILGLIFLLTSVSAAEEGNSKQNIDTDLLTGLLREKQEEVRDRIFQNIIINQFNEGDGVLRNFATYSFLYGTMKDVLNGDRKPEISRAVLRRSTEFAYVLGLALYNDSAKFNDLISRPVKGRIRAPNDSIIRRFNEAMDVSYDILLHNKAIRNRQILDIDTTDDFFMVWYNSESQYRRKVMDVDIRLVPKIFLWRALKDSTRVTALDSGMTLTLDSLMNGTAATDTTRRSRIDTLVQLVFRAGKLDTNGLEAARYDAVRTLLHEFMRLSRNKNGTVSVLMESYLKSIRTRQIQDSALAKGDKLSDSPPMSKLYYFDTGVFLPALTEKFTGDAERRYVYFRPFLNLGINYATPIGPDPAVYFASEKIGFMYKFLNPRYTHSFEPGEVYPYRTPPTFLNRERYWNQPQEKPIVNDYFLAVYASGFLYNIVNLKSDRDFTYPLIGVGIGMTFFNGMTGSFNLAYPMAGKDVKPKQPLVGFSIDIPVIEYLAAVSKKF